MARTFAAELLEGLGSEVDHVEEVEGPGRRERDESDEDQINLFLHQRDESGMRQGPSLATLQQVENAFESPVEKL